MAQNYLNNLVIYNRMIAPESFDWQPLGFELDFDILNEGDITIKSKLHIETE